MAVATELECTTYGTAEAADYRMTDIETGRASVAFHLHHEGEDLGRVELPVPGLHNARNAAAATVTGLLIGVPIDAAARALARFGGVARRFEFRGVARGITFVDDYAHLPTEVAAALAAAGDGGWSRIVCVFQPHRYSRTAAVGADFGPSFAGADVVAVTDVYPSGETPRPGITGRIVADAVTAAAPDTPVVWLPGLEDVVSWLAENLRPGDLCLTLGAGDLTTVPDAVLDRLALSTGSDS
jgi:UDP-N-acetylmuramate--alanine ligase